MKCTDIKLTSAPVRTGAWITGQEYFHSVFFKRKLNNNTALLQKTIKTNWNFALSIRSFTLRLA